MHGHDQHAGELSQRAELRHYVRPGHGAVSERGRRLYGRRHPGLVPHRAALPQQHLYPGGLPEHGQSPMPHQPVLLSGWQRERRPMPRHATSLLSGCAGREDSPHSGREGAPSGAPSLLRPTVTRREGQHASRPIAVVASLGLGGARRRATVIEASRWMVFSLLTEKIGEARSNTNPAWRPGTCGKGEGEDRGMAGTPVALSTNPIGFDE
jgi:hypothetical protein